MIEHHVIIAKMLKERLESKENQNNQNSQNSQNNLNNHDGMDNQDYDNYDNYDDFNGLDDLNQGIVETVRMEDIKEEDFSFKTAKESQFKFVDDEDY